MAKWSKGFPGEAKKANQHSVATRAQRADQHAQTVGPLIHGYREQGHGWGKIAGLLDLAHATPRSQGPWHKAQVKRVYERYLALQPTEHEPTPAPVYHCWIYITYVT